MPKTDVDTKRSVHSIAGLWGSGSTLNGWSGLGGLRFRSCGCSRQGYLSDFLVSWFVHFLAHTSAAAEAKLMATAPVNAE